MKRIAILFNGDICNRKGYTNAVLERAKRLREHGGYCVDVYCLGTYDYWLVRKLRHSVKTEQVESVEVDGLTIKMIWMPFSLIDYTLSVKLNTGKIIEQLFLRQVISRIKSYDLIVAHSTVPGEVAMKASQQYDVPYVITWHGSDIHTSPFINRRYMATVKKIMCGAMSNLFVSKALRETAYKFSNNIPNAEISYNGASDEFRTFTDEERREVRAKYGVKENEKIVGFVGGLVPVKNADKLPEIFRSIANGCENVKFWIIGDGKLRGVIESKLQNLPISIDCKLFGNQPTAKMPELMNCVDLLVLPSENEGLPLVTVESLRCSTNVVAANVGGISEVIGQKNVINHGEDFVDRFSRRCIEALSNGEPAPKLSKLFDWDTIVENEIDIYNKILKI